MFEPWSSHLRNLYWQLRAARVWDGSERRRLYRLIAKEKRRLEETGVDHEELRLLCRMLSNTRNQNAERRYLAYVAQMRLAFLNVAPRSA